ncbi:NUDIX domain-containing protein [Candidatus Nanohaloarchaea archaeon]|nr:NUDIX domain-containing protein [Candidatus Nanohaloarchaea archaeon]
MVETTRHFTATCFVVNSDRVLLHFHKKLDKWLPVGGHIDRDELPHKAAEREVKEESDLNISIEGREKLSDGVEKLPKPDKVLLQDINDHHQHIDSVFYVETDEDDFETEEGIEEMAWLSEKEVKQLDASNEIKKHSLEALEKFR